MALDGIAAIHARIQAIEQQVASNRFEYAGMIPGMT